MKKFFIIFLILLTISAISANVMAQENATKKTGQLTDISIDTAGKTGFLIYAEGYFVKETNGNLTLDKENQPNPRVYFNGTINTTQVKFRILRPIKNGKPYQYIKAAATIDNKPILNAWYKGNSITNNSNNGVNALEGNDNTTGTKKSPGFEGIILMSMILMVCIFKKISKSKNKERGWFI